MFQKFMLSVFLLPPFGISQQYPIVGVWTGADPGNSKLPVRRNINHLFNEKGPIWDLFILGLEAFQAVNETEPDSYYQIAGTTDSAILPFR